jgi:quercetin dioxygenase-like cupin family protein/DNA-binding XRE family transcriptional regulator
MTTFNDEPNVQIGQRIRDLRKKQGLTLKQLGELTGLSSPYLSQIENGHVDLNITNLEAIARALDVPLMAFFVSGHLSGVSITRRSERRWFDLGNYATESPLVKTPGNLEIFTIRLQSSSEPTRDSSHQGEEFTYVIRGSVRIVLNNVQSYDLEEGDIIYYLSDMPHHWQNVGEGEAEILVVNTPATY